MPGNYTCFRSSLVSPATDVRHCKLALLVVIFCMLLFQTGAAQAQTEDFLPGVPEETLHFTLLSSDGMPVAVTFSWYMPENFVVVSLQDGQRICFDNLVGYARPKVIDSTFLEIIYMERCGNICNSDKYRLLTIWNGQLQCAFSGTALFESWLPPRNCSSDTIFWSEEDHYLYEYDYKLIRLDEPMLMRSRRVTVTSQCDPSMNVATSDTAVLNFSREFGVFCAYLDTVSGYFNVRNWKYNLSSDYEEDVVCPVVETPDKPPAFFYRGNWCYPTSDSLNEFTCYDGPNCHAFDEKLKQ